MIDESLLNEAKKEVYRNLASGDHSPSRRSLAIASENIFKRALDNAKSVREHGYDTAHQCKILTTAGVDFWTATKIIRAMAEKES